MTGCAVSATSNHLRISKRYRVLIGSVATAVLISLSTSVGAQSPVDTIFRTIDTIQRQQQQQQQQQQRQQQPQAQPQPQQTPQAQRAAPAPAQQPSLLVRGPSETKAIQGALQTLGFYSGALDGDYGPGTARAVMAWQAASRAAQTGNLSDDQMMTLIQQAANKRSAASNTPSGNDLRQLVIGKEPASIPDNKPLAEAIKAKLGQKVLDSLATYQDNTTADSIQMIGSYAYGAACKPHVCSSEQAR